MGRGVDMLDRAVRHQQSISVREVLPVAGRAVDGLLYAHTIIRVNALHDCIEPDRRGSLALEYSERLFRPDNSPRGGPKAIAAGVAQSLGFGRIHFTLTQRIFGQLAFRDVLACDQDD